MTVLACDFGGRRIKVGMVRDERVVAGEVLPARSELPLADRLPAIVDTLRSLCRSQGIEPRDCAGLVIAYPSIVDVKHARILDQFGKFGDATKFDLRAWARDELQLPLCLENDARLALIGEWQFGAARGVANAVMITLGTGLGSAAVIDGAPLRGTHWQAGILGGHFTVNVHGRKCVCGNVGCAEAEASTSILAYVVRSLPGYAASSLAKIESIGYDDVFRLAAEGDSVAVRIRDHSLKVWGTMAVNLIHAYDPEIVVLGGGVMASRDVILPAVADYVRRSAHTSWGHVNVVASQLGDQVALMGAPWCIQERSSYGV